MKKIVVTVCALVVLAVGTRVDGTIIYSTKTEGKNTFVDGSDRTRNKKFNGGSVASQFLEASIVVNFMKADGESYGENNGGTPYYDEIDLRLISPTGTVVNLISPGDFSTGVGTGGFGFSDVAFWAGTGYPVVNVDPNTPQAGNFIPTGDLGVFLNEDPDGKWEVYTGDTVADDGFSIDYWTLAIWSGDPLSGVTGTDFGDVLVGSPVDQALSVANVGDAKPLESDGTPVSTVLSGAISNPTGPATFSVVGGVSNFSGVVVGGPTADRIFRYNPTVRGPAEFATVDVTTDGGDSTEVLSGRGVAPVAATDTSNTNAGDVRIGDSGTASITVTNLGDGNLSGLGAISNLNGSVSAAAGEFSGGGVGLSLTDGSSTAPAFTYAPTNRGIDLTSVTLNLSNGSADGTNAASSQSIGLSGRGVGPEFMSIGDAAGVIDFGAVAVGDTFTFPLTLMNDTPDGDLGNLTDLSMLGYSIVGADAGNFNVTGYAASVLADGESLALVVEFTSAAAGMFTADLVFSTDQDSPLGIAGTSFTYTLTGLAVIVVPEPATNASMALSFIVFMAALRVRRKRSRRQ